MVKPHSLLTDFDISLFKSGKHFRLYEKMGSHLVTHEGEQGVLFSVWAPNAKRVSVVGDFNQWNPDSHILLPRWDSSGIWEGFIPELGKGTVYKYHIKTHVGVDLDKGNPYARIWETPPPTDSIGREYAHARKESKWLKKRGEKARRFWGGLGCG